MLLQISSRLGKLFAIGWNKSTRILLQTNNTFSYWLERCYSHFATKYKDDTVHASAKNVKTKKQNGPDKTFNKKCFSIVIVVIFCKLLGWGGKCRLGYP